jgi:hypothetical protein
MIGGRIVLDIGVTERAGLTVEPAWSASGGCGKVLDTTASCFP